MKSIPGLTVWKDSEALSIAAAHFFTADCHRCIAEKGSFSVALSGGNTPKRLYELLASPAFSNNIPWKKVFLFWSDERFVPHTDADSNYRMAKEALLDHVPLPKKNIIAIPVKGNPATSAVNYEAAIRQFFDGKKIVFDWLLLGIGDDGHTASLFPGTKVLAERKRLVKEVWVEKKQSWRISFTFPLINRAAQVVFLVTGEEKAGVLATILSKKKIKPLLPAQLVKPSTGLVSWMVGEDAARLL